MPDNSGDTSPEGQPSNCAGAQGADAKAPRLRRLRISDISVGNRLLDINEDIVLALMNSITDVGLIQPIAVSYYGRGRGGSSSYGVKVGAHRLEAHKRLGLKEIDAVIIDLPGRKGMLAEIDENLIRRDLTDAERAKLTAERKRIYELDHPETKHGGDRKGSTRQNGDLKRFTEDTAEKTGRSERSVQRDAARGEALSPDVLDKVKGTVLDKGTELDALARLPEDEQRALAERAKAGEQVSANPKVEPGDNEVDPADEIAANAAIRRRVFFNCAESARRKAEQGAGLRDADGSEIDSEILAAIESVIKAWSELLHDVLGRTPPDDDTPTDQGPKPDGETGSKDTEGLTSEAPAPTDTISAGTSVGSASIDHDERPRSRPQMAAGELVKSGPIGADQVETTSTGPTDPRVAKLISSIPPDLTIPAFLRRAQPATLPPIDGVPVPIKPPAPAPSPPPPAPTPTPAPTPPPTPVPSPPTGPRALDIRRRAKCLFAAGTAEHVA
jgi:ParB-like chromosome segregation protein Spo0J